MRYAMVKNGTVQNVCIWDGNLETWTPPIDVEMVSADEVFVDIGYLYANGTFTVPEVVEESEM